MEQSEGPRRVDARRNAEPIVQAAAVAFVEFGVDVPVREIGRRAGVGVGTICRHFPTRADLVVAVYRHQIADCAAAGLLLLEEELSPFAALTSWAGALRGPGRVIVGGVTLQVEVDADGVVEVGE